MAQQQIYDITNDHELDVLSQIHHNQAVKQRDIAHAIGLSLGMTNAILKRLATKGFITMRRLNARNVHYLVTPDGDPCRRERSGPRFDARVRCSKRTGAPTRGRATVAIPREADSSEHNR